MQYIARITIDKRSVKATVCYLLVDKKNHLVGISSTCVTILNLSVNMLSTYIIDMKLVIPGLFKHEISRKYFHKGGAMAEVFYPNASELCKKFFISSG